MCPLNEVEGLSGRGFLVQCTSLTILSHTHTVLVAIAQGHLGGGGLPLRLPHLLIKVLQTL